MSSSNLIERQRDEAQSMVQAWDHVARGLEAYLMDREANDDSITPALVLSILRGDIALVDERSKQICASRWHNAKQAADRLTQLEGEIEILRDRLSRTTVMLELGNPYDNAVEHIAANRAALSTTTVGGVR